MADEEVTLEVLLDEFHRGTRHHSQRWPQLFADSSGDLAGRVRDVFDKTGLVPTDKQFRDARAAVIEEPPKKATRKAKAEEAGDADG